MGEAVGVVRSKEFCRLTGLTFRQLDYWVSVKGVLTPVRQGRGGRKKGESGSGYWREWGEREIARGRLLRVMLSLGIPGPVIERDLTRVLIVGLPCFIDGDGAGNGWYIREVEGVWQRQTGVRIIGDSNWVDCEWDGRDRDGDGDGGGGSEGGG